MGFRLRGDYNSKCGGDDVGGAMTTGGVIFCFVIVLIIILFEVTQKDKW